MADVPRRVAAVRNARLLHHDGLADVVLGGERIDAVVPSVTGRLTGRDELDADGRVVLPGFVEAHLHLDKAFLGSPGRLGLAEAIAWTAERKAGFTRGDVRKQAEALLRLASSHGTTTIRAYADVDPTVGLMPLEVVLELRERWWGLIDLDVVAFAQEGIVGRPGTGELLARAVELGATTVGGCSSSEATVDECKEHVRLVLDLAAATGVRADFHADLADDARDERFALAGYIAKETAARGLEERVTLGHVTSLASQAPEERATTLRQLADAGVGVVTLPITDLYLAGRADDRSIRRGVVPLRELWSAGVACACASNNVRNAFTPYGNAAPLAVALLCAQLNGLGSRDELDRVVDLVTTDAARLLGMTEIAGIGPGALADLVVLDADAPESVLLDQPEPRQVVKRGVVVAERNSVIRQRTPEFAVRQHRGNGPETSVP